MLRGVGVRGKGGGRWCSRMCAHFRYSVAHTRPRHRATPPPDRAGLRSRSTKCIQPNAIFEVPGHAAAAVIVYVVSHSPRRAMPGVKTAVVR